MGQVNTEQAVKIIDAVGDVIDKAQPDTVTQVQPDPNYWWLLLIGIVPVVLGWWLTKRKK
jgi:p-aminobenzoyl-glutamate transporter AbgT